MNGAYIQPADPAYKGLKEQIIVCESGKFDKLDELNVFGLVETHPNALQKRFPDEERHQDQSGQHDQPGLEGLRPLSEGTEWFALLFHGVHLRCIL